MFVAKVRFCPNSTLHFSIAGVQVKNLPGGATGRMRPIAEVDCNAAGLPAAVKARQAISAVARIHHFSAAAFVKQ